MTNHTQPLPPQKTALESHPDASPGTLTGSPDPKTSQSKSSKLSLSYSKLDTLAHCPHCYYRRYVLKEPEVVGAAAIMGSAFHLALEHNFKHKKETGLDMPLNDVAKVYRDAFDERAQLPTFKDLETLTEDQIDWGGQDPKELREQGQKALARYHKQHAPFIEPLMIEERLERDLGEVLLVGILDLVTTSGTVVDYKLVKSVWPEHKIAMGLQPTVYAALLDLPVSFNFHFITKTPKSPVGISVKRTIRTRNDIDWLIDTHIPQAVEMIRSELWIRNPGMLCHFCSHRLGCGYRVQ